jgi:hypothetical protein
MYKLSYSAVHWLPFVKPLVNVFSVTLSAARGVTLTTYPHLMPSSRMSRIYISSPPKRLHGVQWDSFSFYLQLLVGDIYIL